MTQPDSRTPGLEVILRPRSVAVIGAGRDPESMSGRLFRNLLASFEGPLYPVNPKAEEIASIATYPSIEDVPGQVDLAFVAVPADQVPTVVRQCLDRGVRGLVLITAGFAEIGAEGQRRQTEVLELIRSSGVRLVGPNCLGIVNTDPAAQLDGTFSGFPFRRGNVGVCTQSGALGFVIPDLLRAYQLGLSFLVSMGNRADIGENDLLAFWEEDPRTDVCLLYLESFQDPRRFLETARRVSPRKPIVVLKAGRTGSGTRAAGSHTAAMASPDSAATAVLRQAGAIRVGDLQEFFDVATLLATQPAPAGRRVAILTNAGGPGVLCADALEAHGLSVPLLSSALQRRLRVLVRPEAIVSNPVDLVGSNDPELFARCLRLLLEANEFETVLVMFVPIRPGDSSRIARAVFDLRRASPSPHTLLALFVESKPPTSDLSNEEMTIPVFAYPECAAAALAQAVKYGEWTTRGAGVIPGLEHFDPVAIRGVVEGWLASHSPGENWLPQDVVQRLLGATGLAVPRWSISSTADQAAGFAETLGGPVVAKIDSPTILHKKAAGGVVANIQGAQALRAAFDRLALAAPDTRGILIQELVPEGVDVLIGVTWDEMFGHRIGCGLGGSLVEAFASVDFRLHPLTDYDAEDLIRDNPVGRFLTPAADRAPVARNALRDALLRVSALVTLVPEIVEADLNPVRILPDQSLSVLDARFRLR